MVIVLKKFISNLKDCLLYSAIYILTPWMIKVTPISIAANSGLVSDNPPRANAKIPKIIINIEAIFDAPGAEIRPAIPSRIIIIPIM